MIYCASCGASDERRGRFCSSCGVAVREVREAGPAAPIAAVAIAAAPIAGIAIAAVARPAPLNYPPTGLRMCGACGANVPASLASCGACNGAPSPNMTLPGPQGGANWVQVRLYFGCVQCQQRSPINHLDVDGRYYCFTCQQDRFFDADLWQEQLVPLAAATGDFFWTNTRVFPPFPTVIPEEDWFEDQQGWDSLADCLPGLLRDFLPHIGVARPRLTAEREGTVMAAGGVLTATYQVALFPGHPMCQACQLPYEAAFSERGRVSVRCPGCGVVETHRTPQAALDRCPDLLAALAPDHVEGRAAARVEPRAGTAALGVMCPHCGSPLALSAGVRLARCAHCGTSSLVPERAFGGSQPVALAWWMAVYGPSSLRRLLLQPNAGKSDDDDDDDDDAVPSSY